MFTPVFPLKTQNLAKPGLKEKTTYETNHKWLLFKWAHLGSNQGPPDYESGALTN